ncbi:MAG: hypothetical protein Q9165_001692 [Trypethelium subeluteriae]
MLSPKLLKSEHHDATAPSSTDLLESEDPDPDHLQQTRPRDRSPHPYLYHTEELRALRHASLSAETSVSHNEDALNTSTASAPLRWSPGLLSSTAPRTSSPSPLQQPSDPLSSPANGTIDPKFTYTDHDGRARRRPVYRSTTSTTSNTIGGGGSESGTEADDEGAPPLVKALPAPRLRPRKGLRGAIGEEDGSQGLEELDALMTPRFLEEEQRKAYGGGKEGYFEKVFGMAVGRPMGKEMKEGRGRGGKEKEGLESGEVGKKWEEFRKKRRAELVRRVSETVLLVLIGLAVLSGKGVWKKVWEWHRAELGVHVAIFVLLCAVYPLRLIKYSLQRALEEGGPRRYGIRVPSAFDPATLLYPAFLPVMVALSLSPLAGELILPNVVLGLSALPTRLVFKFGTPLGYDPLHWFLAVVPLFASQWTQWPDKLFPPKPYGLKAPSGLGLDAETIVCLYPLQRALMQPLHFLTTTSLLPAELQLLATALINVWLFASSPQATILSALLLPGGLSLFIFCRHVLQWNVALARIPRWRLRRAGRVIMARDTFLDTLAAGLRSKGLPLPFTNSLKESPGSDADEDGHLLDNVRHKTSKPRLRSLTTQLRNSVDHDDGTRSAIEPPSKISSPLLVNGATKDSPDIRPRKRRYTMANVSELQSPLDPPQNPSSGANLAASSTSKSSKRNRITSLAHPYLSLTPAQATIRKWIYAAYTYIVTLLVILIPLRSYIGTHALNNTEPFGWALGYLFGSIEPLRTLVESYHLSTWIPLPTPNPPPLHLPPRDLLSQLLHHNPQPLTLSSLRTLLGGPTTRLLLTTHWLLTLTLGLTLVLILPYFTPIEVDTRRKLFHGTMVALLLPTIPFDPCFAALTLALVLAVFLLLDTFRAAQVAPIAGPLAAFLQPYVDGRDLRGPVVVSHMFLLIGCAIPLWLSLAGVGREGKGAWKGWEIPPGTTDVSMLAGVVCVGMGDAAASLVGRRFGRRKWLWTGGKSLEGSAAFVGAVTAGLLFGKAWLRFGGWEGVAAGGIGGWGSWEEWSMVGLKASLAACGASLMEAVLTGGNDNVIVPVVLWLLVRGVRL